MLRATLARIPVTSTAGGVMGHGIALVERLNIADRKCKRSRLRGSFVDNPSTAIGGI